MNRERRLKSKAVPHREPDLQKLSRALVRLAEAQAEADAEQEHRGDVTKEAS